MSVARRRTRLTRRGIGTLVGATIVVSGGIVLRVGELLGIGAAGVVIPLIALARVRLAARGVDVETSLSHEPGRPIRGRPVTIRATVRNLGRRMLVARVEVAADFVASPPLDDVRVRPGATVDVASTSEAWRRGQHRIGPIRFRIADGAGLAETQFVDPVSTETLVLPSFVPVERAPTLPPEERAAGRTRRSPLRGTEFHALRDYQRGDDLRQVHWRASAKHGSLLVREVEPLAMPRFTIVFDDRRASHPDHALFEMAVSAATAVVTGLGQRGFGIQVITSDGRLDGHVYGRASVERLVERLALVEPTPAVRFADTIRRAMPVGRGGGLLLIASAGLDAESQDVLAQAGRRYGFAGAFLIAANDRAGNVRPVAAALMNGGWRVVRVGTTGTPALDRHVPQEAWTTLLARART